MVKKKICMLGYFAVGKTSLVRRYVENMFSDKYQTTIGVKISKKSVAIQDQTIELVLWDLAGRDGVTDISSSYLRGSSGYLLVLDKTRSNTIYEALDIHNFSVGVLGDVPFLVLLNKCDIEGSPDFDREINAKLQQFGVEIIRTSAKTGMGVEEAFVRLTRKILDSGT